MAQNTHNVQNIDSRDGQKTKERQPLFYRTSVQDDNLLPEYFFVFFISNEPPQFETIANDVLSVNKLNILDFNCKNVLTKIMWIYICYKNIGSLTVNVIYWMK